MGFYRPFRQESGRAGQRGFRSVLGGPYPGPSAGVSVDGMLCALVLPQLVLLVSPPARAAQPEPRVLAVLAELDRMAARPLWPGFEPREVPLEIFDRARTWLLRHPRPPAEFAPVSGRAGALVFEGRHESLRANTSIELAGV